ncbi:hypothetical protein DL93DRAFT_2100533 [Clavulina sp. PMI_390]|nr:hypothetical protein DL93DRAFT_2100533 [Clavulina sp. PMI_390]
MSQPAPELEISRIGRVVGLMMVEEIIPLLLADGHLDIAEIQSHKMVSDAKVWHILLMTASKLMSEGDKLKSTEINRLNAWIKRGLVKWLIDVVIKLSPILNDLFANGLLSTTTTLMDVPGWQWTSAMTILYTLCDADARWDGVIDAEPGMGEIRAHSIALIKAWLAMENLLAMNSSSEAAYEVAFNLGRISRYIVQYLSMRFEATVTKEDRSFSADLAERLLVLTIKVREFFTRSRHSSSISRPRPLNHLKNTKDHDILWCSALIAQFCIRVLFVAGGFEHPHQLLCNCGSHSTHGFSVSSITGFSLQRLVDQASYVEHDNCQDRLKHQRYEYGLLSLMVSHDPAPTALIRILARGSYFVSTMGVAREALTNSDFMANFGTRGGKYSLEERNDHYVLEFLAGSWHFFMQLAVKEGNTALPKVAIDHGLVSLLELIALNDYEQSVSPSKYYLNELPKLIYSTLASQHEVEEVRPDVAKLILQIVTVHRRLTLRPEVSKVLVKSWSETVLWAHVACPGISVTAVCSNPGCSSIEIPELQCGRCRLNKYCSKGCQKSEWREPITSNDPMPTPPSVPKLAIRLGTSPAELAFTHRVVLLAREKILPLLMASGHIEEARARANKENADISPRSPQRDAVLGSWIKAGLVGRLLDIIIKLSPVFDDLFVGDLMSTNVDVNVTGAHG